MSTQEQGLHVDRERLGNAGKSLFHTMRDINPAQYGAIDAATDKSWARVYFSPTECSSLPTGLRRFLIENAGEFVALSMHIVTYKKGNEFPFTIDINPLGAARSQDVIGLSSSQEAASVDELGEYGSKIKTNLDIASDTAEWISGIIEKRISKQAA